jgi:hypothetical protein
MRRPNIDFIVDTLALAALVFLAATGILIRYVLPSGSGHFSTLWGMDRHQWGQIHFWIAAALIAITALHLVLHWRWIVTMVKGRRREGSGMRVAIAVVVLLALGGLAAAPFLAQVEHTAEPPRRMHSDGEPAGATFQINGSMSLQQIEQQTGVPASVILSELGLPPEAPTDESLGRLRKQHDFEMSAVRRIVQEQTQQ